MPTRVANRFATAFLLCAGLGCAVFAGDRGSRAEQSRYSDWAEGPVRYLITKTESRLFRKLPTPDERLAFIRRFWDRRDPNPVTPANEARLAFWQRVSEANAQFSDSALPGWKTDRGKIYILLGPPDDIERDFEYDTRIAGSANRGLMRWVYKGIDNASTRAIQVVPFVRLDDSDWHLTDDPRFASATFNIYDDPTTSASAFYREYGSFSRFADDLPWLGSRLGTAMDLGRLQEVPTESDLLTAVVRAEDFLGTLPGALVVHALHGPGGRNLLALTIAVKRDALTPAWAGTGAELASRFTASAGLVSLDANVSPSEVEFPDEAFIAEPAPIEGDPWIRLQAIREVPAGRWRARAVVIDRQAGAAAVVESALTIDPLPQRGPRLNGPIVAAGLLPAQDHAHAGERPYKMGEALVIPRLDREIPRDRPFAIFIEIAAARGDDRAVALAWDIAYREPGAAEPRPFGKEGRIEDARGPRAWEFDGGRFAPGEYTITFRATDADGIETVARVAFSIL